MAGEAQNNTDNNNLDQIVKMLGQILSGMGISAFSGGVNVMRGLYSGDSSTLTPFTAGSPMATAAVQMFMPLITQAAKSATDAAFGYAANDPNRISRFLGTSTINTIDARRRSSVTADLYESISKSASDESVDRATFQALATWAGRDAANEHKKNNSALYSLVHGITKGALTSERSRNEDIIEALYSDLPYYDKNNPQNVKAHASRKRIGTDLLKKIQDRFEAESNDKNFGYSSNADVTTLAVRELNYNQAQMRLLQSTDSRDIAALQYSGITHNTISDRVVAAMKARSDGADSLRSVYGLHKSQAELNELFKGSTGIDMSRLTAGEARRVGAMVERLRLNSNWSDADMKSASGIVRAQLSAAGIDPDTSGRHLLAISNYLAGGSRTFAASDAEYAKGLASASAFAQRTGRTSFYALAMTAYQQKHGSLEGFNAFMRSNGIKSERDLSRVFSEAELQEAAAGYRSSGLQNRAQEWAAAENINKAISDAGTALGINKDALAAIASAQGVDRNKLLKGYGLSHTRWNEAMRSAARRYGFSDEGQVEAVLASAKQNEENARQKINPSDRIKYSRESVEAMYQMFSRLGGEASVEDALTVTMGSNARAKELLKKAAEGDNDARRLTVAELLKKYEHITKKDEAGRTADEKKWLDKFDPLVKQLKSVGDKGSGSTSIPQADNSYGITGSSGDIAKIAAAVESINRKIPQPDNNKQRQIAGQTG